MINLYIEKLIRKRNKGFASRNSLRIPPGRKIIQTRRAREGDIFIRNVRASSLLADSWTERKERQWRSRAALSFFKAGADLFKAWSMMQGPPRIEDVPKVEGARKRKSLCVESYISRPVEKVFIIYTYA